MDVHLAGSAKHQYRTRSRSDDTLRDTPSQEMTYAGPAVCPHDHEVRTIVNGRLRDALRGFSGSNFGGDVQRPGGQPPHKAFEALPRGLVALLVNISGFYCTTEPVRRQAGRR